MKIYVDGSMSTKVDGAQEALMKEARRQIPAKFPTSVEIFGFNHDMIWPIVKDSDQGLHPGGADLQHVIDQAPSGEMSLIVTDDEMLVHKYKYKLPYNVMFSVIKIEPKGNPKYELMKKLEKSADKLIVSMEKSAKAAEVSIGKHHGLSWTLTKPMDEDVKW